MSKVFGQIIVKAAGTTMENRQGILWNLRKHEDGAYLTLRREKKNKADANAIAVIAHPKGTKPAKIGYIPKDTAKWLAKYMDAEQIVRAYRVEKDKPFVIGKGTKDYYLGCKFKVVYELREADLNRAYAVETE